MIHHARYWLTLSDSVSGFVAPLQPKFFLSQVPPSLAGMAAQPAPGAHCKLKPVPCLIFNDHSLPCILNFDHCLIVFTYLHTKS